MRPTFSVFWDLILLPKPGITEAMAERRPLFASKTSFRNVWKTWLPVDAVVMARRAQAQQNTHEIPQEAKHTVVLIVVTDPWSEQDPQARPLLDRMIQAMGLSSEKVAILETGESDLQKRVLELHPQSAVTLGASAAQTMLGAEFSFERQRGQWHNLGDLKVMPTLDLQTLLKNPSAKKEAWADLQKVIKILAK